MNKVQKFLNETFGEVRVVEINNVLWFVGFDVARVLQYPKATDMTRNLDDDETDTQTLLIRSDNGVEQNRECLVINESGLYNAVLSITKRNPERYRISRNFKRWITNEVIPTIRNTGGYVEDEREDEFVHKYFPSFSEDVKLAMVQDLLKTNKVLKTQADKWSKFLDTESTYSFTEVSKLISTMAKEENSDVSISVIKLTDFLRSEGVLSKAKSPDTEKHKGKYKNLPNKDYENYFDVVTIDVKGKFNKTQTRIKALGVEYIYDLVKEKYNKAV